MAIFVALLCSVNVGGKNRLPMAELRETLTSKGYERVRTLLQSGNVLFEAPPQGEASLEAALSELIRARYGLSIEVIIRSLEAFREALSNSPFISQGAEVERTYISFLKQMPETGRTKQLATEDSEDRLVVIGLEAHLTCSGGYSDTRFSNAWLERWLGVKATTRGYPTCLKLLALAET